MNRNRSAKKCVKVGQVVKQPNKNTPDVTAPPLNLLALYLASQWI